MTGDGNERLSLVCHTRRPRLRVTELFCDRFAMFLCENYGKQKKHRRGSSSNGLRLAAVKGCNQPMTVRAGFGDRMYAVPLRALWESLPV